MSAQAERVAVAGLLIAVATALVLLGKLTGDAWASYTQWVIAFVLAHHAVSSGSDVAASYRRAPSAGDSYPRGPSTTTIAIPAAASADSASKIASHGSSSAIASDPAGCA
jgi:hypothetical protein